MKAETHSKKGKGDARRFQFYKVHHWQANSPKATLQPRGYRVGCKRLFGLPVSLFIDMPQLGKHPMARVEQISWAFVIFIPASDGITCDSRKRVIPNHKPPEAHPSSFPNNRADDKTAQYGLHQRT
jgi:hypothetical protein